MRQLLTARFLATLGALAGLTVVLYALVLGGDDPVSEVAEAGPTVRRIDLVSLVFSVSAEGFAMEDGRSVGTLDLVLDAQRTVHVVPGTYGEVTCEALDEVGSCAVVADLLGDAAPARRRRGDAGDRVARQRSRDARQRLAGAVRATPAPYVQPRLPVVPSVP
jgi:hypothetical protein